MVRLHRIAMVVAAMAAFVLMASPGWAAATANESKIGVVDLQKVASDAPLMKQYSDEIMALNNSLTEKMRLRDQLVMLNETEMKELLDLKAKPSLTTAEDARVKGLTDIERGRDAELKKLQQTKDLGAQDKTRLNELRDIQLKSSQARDTAAKDYQSQVQTKGQELWAKAELEMEAVVAKIAQAKSLPFVVAKGITMADGTVGKSVLFGGVDITDDVIGKLPRSTK